MCGVVRGRAQRHLDAQILVQAVDLPGQLCLGEFLEHLAVLDEEEAVGQRRGEAEVLLHITMV